MTTATTTTPSGQPDLRTAAQALLDAIPPHDLHSRQCYGAWFPCSCVRGKATDTLRAALARPEAPPSEVVHLAAGGTAWPCGAAASDSLGDVSADRVTCLNCLRRATVEIGVNLAVTTIAGKLAALAALTDLRRAVHDCIQQSPADTEWHGLDEARERADAFAEKSAPPSVVPEDTRALLGRILEWRIPCRPLCALVGGRDCGAQALREDVAAFAKRIDALLATPKPAMLDGCHPGTTPESHNGYACGIDCTLFKYGESPAFRPCPQCSIWGVPVNLAPITVCGACYDADPKPATPPVNTDRPFGDIAREIARRHGNDIGTERLEQDIVSALAQVQRAAHVVAKEELRSKPATPSVTAKADLDAIYLVLGQVTDCLSRFEESDPGCPKVAGGEHLPCVASPGVNGPGDHCAHCEVPLVPEGLVHRALEMTKAHWGRSGDPDDSERPGFMEMTRAQMIDALVSLGYMQEGATETTASKHAAALQIAAENACPLGGCVDCPHNDASEQDVRADERERWAWYAEAQSNLFEKALPGSAAHGAMSNAFGVMAVNLRANHRRLPDDVPQGAHEPEKPTEHPWTGAPPVSLEKQHLDLQERLDRAQRERDTARSGAAALREARGPELRWDDKGLLHAGKLAVAAIGGSEPNIKCLSFCGDLLALRRWATEAEARGVIEQAVRPMLGMTASQTEPDRSGRCEKTQNCPYANGHNGPCVDIDARIAAAVKVERERIVNALSVKLNRDGDWRFKAGINQAIDIVRDETTEAPTPEPKPLTLEEWACSTCGTKSLAFGIKCRTHPNCHARCCGDECLTKHVPVAPNGQT